MTEESQDTKINALEKDLVGVNFKLESQGKVLEEIRDVLVQQSKILENVTAIRETVNQVRSDVDQLEETFESRKKDTDNAHKDFRDFVSRAKGGLAVFLVVFSLVQGMVVHEFNDNKVTHKELQLEIRKLEKDIIILQSSKSAQNGSGLIPRIE